MVSGISCTMAIFQGTFFLTAGLLLLGVVYRSLSLGSLPLGSDLLKGSLKLQKAENPIGFWAAFVLYVSAGVALILLAALILTSVVPPLPLLGSQKG